MLIGNEGDTLRLIKTVLFSALIFHVLCTGSPPVARSQEPINNTRLWVFKSQRELWLIKGGKVKKVYHISLGRNSKGPKLHKGDNRTPEGEYFISEKKINTPFHRFLALSYPNITDADQALERRLIAPKQWADIWFALQINQTPPANTPLGGRIGIHGQGALDHQTQRILDDIDWTKGCIAITNTEIEELYRLIPLGTPVKIWK